ncbi:Hypothetical predicted protein [Mytilus galloprovincialis]|uniref:Integrase core domain-containing protein n=1 Tax=Mytilus galloprovincialis TaxID=29158 RepID=A0A8B6G370_MYTGA|nr:Hypothetical predicted protein [Mytilus galloprovincialis]
MIPDEIKQCISKMFYEGYPYRLMHYILEKKKNFQISFQYLQHKVIPRLGLKRRNCRIDIDTAISLAVSEIQNGCNGCENLRRSLKIKYHLQITRSLSRELVRILDADGIERRKGRRLRRRKYISRGPNYVWHLDGYDKLKPFGICIHGCVDGFSRKIIWLQASITNKRPEVVADFFLKAVDNIKAFPSKIRCDPGTENGLTAAIQLTHTSDKKSVIYGSSVYNQRIERYWGWLRQSKSDFWINHFKCLEADGILNVSSQIHKLCLQFVYLPVIQKDLAELTVLWNSHNIRKQNQGDILSGIPDVLYHYPEVYGTSDFCIPADDITLNFFKDQCNHEANLFKKIDEDFEAVLIELRDNLNIPPVIDSVQNARHLFIYLKERMENLLS